jgi:hypothetical protein
MPDTDNPNTPVAPSMVDSLKSWTMVIITLVFVILYALSIAEVGKLTISAVKELQPIVFVIIGYYFGRLPAQQVESALKEQVRGQANNATAARNAERTAEVERGVFEEKIKNTRTILETVKPGAGAEGMAKGTTPVEAAIKILSS